MTKALFKNWLETKKMFSVRTSEEVIFLYDKVNDYVKTIGNNDMNIYDISADVYSNLLKKNLTKKILLTNLGVNSKNFWKYSKLYEEFLKTDFITQPLKEEREKETFNEELLENDNEEKTVKNKFFNSEIDRQLDIYGVITQSYLSYFDKIKRSVNLIPTVNNEINKKMNFIFDFFNNKVLCFDEKENLEKDIPLVYINKKNGKDKIYYCQPNGVYYEQRRYSFLSALVSQSLEIFNYNIIEKSIQGAIEGHKLDQNSLFCLYPDLLDDFNGKIREQLHYQGNKLFPVPRSVALMFYLQKVKQLNFKASENIIFIDFDGPELAVVNLMMVNRPYTKDLVILRKSLMDYDSGSYLNYQKVSYYYLQEYEKKYQIQFEEQIKTELVESHKIIDILSTKNNFTVFNNGELIKIKFEPDFYKSIEKIVQHNITELKKDLHLKENDKIFILNSYLDKDNYYSYNDLFLGSKIVRERLNNGDFLWEEYLPKLVLEVNTDDHFDYIDLISEKDRYAQVTQALQNEQKFDVVGIATLKKGETVINLPLERDVFGNYNKEKVASFQHEQFPLEEDLKVKLEVHYKYGNANSFYIKAIPFNSKIKEIINTWEDVQEITNYDAPTYDLKPVLLERNEALDVYNTFINLQKSLLNYRMGRGNDYSKTKKSMGKYVSKLFTDVDKKFKQVRAFFTKESVTNYRDLFIDLMNKNFFKTIFELMVDVYKIPNRFYEQEDKDALLLSLKEFSSKFGVFYAHNKFKDIETSIFKNFLAYFLNLNDLNFFITMTRLMEDDRHHLFDKITNLIISNYRKKTYGFEILQRLRDMASNCWQTEKWIELLYNAKDGKQAINILVDSINYFIATEDPYNNIKEKLYNPRKIRDLLELLLCISRVKPDCLNPNDEKVKELIRKIKKFDCLMYHLKEDNKLEFDFVSRLNKTKDGEISEVKKINELTYLLVKTLTGSEKVHLVSYDDQSD